ncbi:hypothetical protein CRI70_31375 [Streptomyces sp. Ru87]|nr:hypothetical protein CRI70_31375 [Streptomyces sp. Ru87]
MLPAPARVNRRPGILGDLAIKDVPATSPVACLYLDVVDREIVNVVNQGFAGTLGDKLRSCLKLGNRRSDLGGVPKSLVRLFVGGAGRGQFRGLRLLPRSR